VRFACLGSGSEGNGLLVEAGATRVLIDCGFGIRDCIARLARLGVAAESLDAIVVTHEHSDHIGGVAAMAARFDIAVWLTFGTLDCVSERFADLPRIYGIDSYQPFVVGELELDPIAVPHDAREPVQFICSDGRKRMALLTDLGFSTPYVEMRLSACDALVLECNHDLDMLADGDYPWQLKQRISSRLGHLHNEASADLLAALDTSRLKHIIAAHLSQQNNTPDKARAALAGALNCAPGWVGIADQAEGFGWREM
jgi:phosphoribosyl 1,2-cyclic phosphodiesterase